MALIIPSLKQGRKTTVNAYAKIGRISYDNKTKKANFDIVVTKTKEDTEVLLRIGGLTTDIVGGTDMVQQCYNSIDAKIAAVELEIVTLQAEVDIDSTDRRKVFKIATMKALPILTLKNAIGDNIPTV